MDKKPTPAQMKFLHWLARGPVLKAQAYGSGRTRVPDDCRRAGWVEPIKDLKVKDSFGYPADALALTEKGRTLLNQLEAKHKPRQESKMTIYELGNLIASRDPTGKIYAENAQEILDLIPNEMRVPYNQKEGHQPIAAEYDEDDNIIALLYWNCDRAWWDIEEEPDEEQLTICNVSEDGN